MEGGCAREHKVEAQISGDTCVNGGMTHPSGPQSNGNVRVFSLPTCYVLVINLLFRSR